MRDSIDPAKTRDEPKKFITFYNRPNCFRVGVSHKQFLFSKSFKPRTFISGGLIEIIFKRFVALFKFIKTFHVQILPRSFANVPGEIAEAGPIKAECEGDTAIGRSIETALGIQINSSRNPDFKGIEIKSGRSAILASRENRANLFACVPDWDLSALKSSGEILERFGYQREDDFKLYCTVSTRRANSQGLQLEVQEAEKWLREFCAREPVEEVCVWRLDKLHERLAEKHREPPHKSQNLRYLHTPEKIFRREGRRAAVTEFLGCQHGVLPVRKSPRAWRRKDF